MQVKKQQLKPDMEQQTDSKLGKEYVNTAYSHPAYLNYVRSISCKMLRWITQSYNQDYWEKYEQPQIMQMITL